MYVQVGDFCVSRGLTTVLLTGILCDTVFSKSQNARKAGTLCISFFVFILLAYFLDVQETGYDISKAVTNSLEVQSNVGTMPDCSVKPIVIKIQTIQV